MTPVAKYTVAGISVAALAILASRLFLGPAGRLGVAAAAAVAVPVQTASFAVLVRFRGRTRAFLAAWIGGTAARMAVLVAAAIAAVRSDAGAAVPMLLALAGFFFAFLLLEPLCFGLEAKEAAE